MPKYLVEMRGIVREVYLVEAPDACTAQETWMSGELVSSGAFAMEPHDVEEAK
jgi:hypothetical protein